MNTTSTEIRPHPPQQYDPLDRLPLVLTAYGGQKSQLYSDISADLFTPPVKVGVRASRWPRSEVIAICRARVAGKSNDEIRQLVKKLVAARTAPAA